MKPLLPDPSNSDEQATNDTVLIYNENNFKQSQKALDIILKFILDE